MANSRVFGAILLMALVPAWLATFAAAPATAQDPEATSWRISAGSDPVEASLAISRETFASGTASQVVLGRDDIFADTLAGAPLAGTSGPILLTDGGPTASLHEGVEMELGRVLGGARTCSEQRVYLLGGPQALSRTLEGQVEALGYCVIRLFGPTRVETSAAVAQEVARRSSPTRVVLASSKGWPDSAAAGAYAAATSTPVLVTPPGQLHEAIRTAIRQLAPKEVVIVGGERALSAAVEQGSAALVATRRVAGPARDATATAIASQLWPEDRIEGLALVHGYREDSWAHALALAPGAARLGAPVAYVSSKVPPAVAELIRTGTYGFAVAVGGPAAVSDAVLEEVRRGMTEAARHRRSPHVEDETGSVAHGREMGAHNTGVTVPASQLEPSRRVIADVDGQVIEGLDVRGSIHVRADNVTIRNVRIRTHGSLYGIHAAYGHTGTVIEHVEVDASQPRDSDGQVSSAAVYGTGMTLRRSHIHGGVDGVKFGTDTLIEENYIHDQTRVSGGHHDGMQTTGGTDMTVRRNRIEGPYRRSTSAIIAQTNRRSIADFVVEDNHLSGGSYTFYLRLRYPEKGYTVEHVTVRGNEWQADSWTSGPLSTRGSNSTWTMEDNRTHTGTPIGS